MVYYMLLENRAFGLILPSHSRDTHLELIESESMAIISIHHKNGLFESFRFEIFFPFNLRPGNHGRNRIEQRMMETTNVRCIVMGCNGVTISDLSTPMMISMMIAYRFRSL